jgi:NAD(P)-dependent dehydrogenase (short-subunit alcohol dehydrogenase family)
MKTAIITGASTGIGRAVSLALAKNDFEVFLVARNEIKLEETRKLIEKDGGKASVLSADLSNTDSVNKFIKSIRQQTDHLDLIANIAGIWHGEDDVYAGKDFERFDQQTILDTFNVGTISPALIVHGLLPLMQSGGKIINLSGTFENGAKGWLPYYVSKRAIEDLTVALAQELEKKGIQVNCISPSDTATEAYSKFFPQYMDDAIEPEQIAMKFVELSDPKNPTTGKIIVMKKETDPFEAFHY